MLENIKLPELLPLPPAASEAGEGNGSSRTQLDAAARSCTQPHAAESAAQGFDFARGGGEGPERSKE